MKQDKFSTEENMDNAEMLRQGDSMNILQKVLALDLANLTDEEVAWLHKLKNLATVLMGHLQLREMKATEAENAAYLVKAAGVTFMCTKESAQRRALELINEGYAPYVEVMQEVA